MAISYPSISAVDAAFTILVADVKQRSDASQVRVDKSNLTILTERVSNLVKSIFVKGEKESWIKRFFAQTEPLDKGLKFAKAVIDTNSYVEGRDLTHGEKTASKYITDVRGGIVCMKVLTGIPVIIELFKKFVSHFNFRLEFDPLACAYDFLALSSVSLFETANLSKGMNFIRKYVEYGSAGTKKFCSLYPKIFFGLHISSTVQHLLGFYYDRSKYLRGNMNMKELWERTKGIDADRVSSFDNIRAHELAYMKSTVSRIMMLVKNTFEFLGDAGNFTQICRPLAIASLIGVAVVDLTAELLALKV